VASDEFSRFTWILLNGFPSLPRDIYVAVCYFPPMSSQFSIHSDSSEDPYMDLYASINKYSTMGDVILLGDFNACTRALQIPLHDRSKDMFCIQERNPDLVGLQQTLDGAFGALTGYGRHLLQLGGSHELLILNGLPCFPESRFFTCRPHGGGVSVVDYVLIS
jgi:hypothetical protein